jgi:AcrR family transcriptional regulator
MPNEPTDASAARRGTIVESAIGVFARYGFKKTSMDDLARAAGLSRQGLYLHFATKEVLFKAVVLHVIESSRNAARVALARDNESVEERLLEAFAGAHGHLVGRAGAEHLGELLEAASQLLAEEMKEIELSFVAEITKFLKHEGIAERWKGAGLSAKELAAHLDATSHGVKQRPVTLAEYRDAMRVAVRLVCRGSAR